MDDETSYWLKVGKGPNAYTKKVSVETYMAMERVCGFRNDVPPDRINLPVTEHFLSPGEHDLMVEGWVWNGIMGRPVSDH